MTTRFIHINQDWNAEPNDPEPMVSLVDGVLFLEFYANPWAYEGYAEGEKLRLEFSGCKRYRLGRVNDEGWYRGQCRFSTLAPKWGEFYELQGDRLLEKCPSDWIDVGPAHGPRHFLFYFRDEEFECEADSFEMKRRE